VRVEHFADRHVTLPSVRSGDVGSPSAILCPC
jgi:hypothetical protein